MKKLLYPTIALLFIAGTTEVLQQLKTDAGRVYENTLSAVTSGYIYYPSTVRQVATTARLEIAKTLLPFIKEYTKSEDFKKRYAEWWRSVEPKKPMTAEERRAKRTQEGDANKKQADEQIKQMKQQIASTTDADTKKALEEGLKAYEEMQQQMNTPEMQEYQKTSAAYMDQADKDQAAKDMEDYNKLNAEWKEKQNPNVLIKKRLQTYLETVGSVDFTAKLVPYYGKQNFADPKYQSKPANWKLIYRAGKDVNDYAKPFVQQWVTELK